MIIEEEWYYDRLQQDDTSAMKEYEAIREAVDNFEELSLSGGIIYANNVPVAMTIASYINDAAVDIHLRRQSGNMLLMVDLPRLTRCMLQRLKMLNILTGKKILTYQV